MRADGLLESASQADGPTALWERYCRYHLDDRALGFSLDVSRVRFDCDWLETMTPVMAAALEAMASLEGGALLNHEEQRMVGHYWLRCADMAPDASTEGKIRDTLNAVKAFAAAVRAGETVGQCGVFSHVLFIGIGGSALGPQFLTDALKGYDDRLTLQFMDNTDPQGIAETLDALAPVLGRTLVVVMSKSGDTPEPRNAMVETARAFERAGLDFPRHAVAVTMAGSRLDRLADKSGWQRRFPMWDWVGGRTSAMSVVGLLPLALIGADVDRLLEGAATMDRWTREEQVCRNPAAMMALMWHYLGRGRGEKDMVILPYKDRLLICSRYLQQLVMESLGKALDRSGRRVEQGIAVYGNKGSTDQHAYVQQLRDGVANFFVTFVQVLDDGVDDPIAVEPGITSGDYLCGFLLGTREALYENKRDSITITMDRVDAVSIGALIALFERAVGLYAELIDINAYHQPGVEAGKAAAAEVLAMQAVITGDMAAHPAPRTATEVAASIGRSDAVETVYRVLEHLAANPGRGVSATGRGDPVKTRFAAVGV